MRRYAIKAEGWEGWEIEGGYLRDPAGNRYLPWDLQATFYARQAWEARAGYPGELKFMRQRLNELIQEAQSEARPSFVVEIKRQTPAGEKLVQTVRFA